MKLKRAGNGYQSVAEPGFLFLRDTFGWNPFPNQPPKTDGWLFQVQGMDWSDDHDHYCYRMTFDRLKDARAAAVEWWRLHPSGPYADFAAVLAVAPQAAGPLVAILDGDEAALNAALDIHEETHGRPWPQVARLRRYLRDLGVFDPYFAPLRPRCNRT